MGFFGFIMYGLIMYSLDWPIFTLLTELQFFLCLEFGSLDDLSRLKKCSCFVILSSEEIPLKGKAKILSIPFLASRMEACSLEESLSGDSSLNSIFSLDARIFSYFILFRNYFTRIDLFIYLKQSRVRTTFVYYC
jgi:hypothetical protein